MISSPRLGKYCSTWLYDQHTDSPDAYIEKGVFTKENSPLFDWTDIADPQSSCNCRLVKEMAFEKLQM